MDMEARLKERQAVSRRPTTGLFATLGSPARPPEHRYLLLSSSARHTARQAPLPDADKRCDIPARQVTAGGVYFTTDSRTNSSQTHCFPRDGLSLPQLDSFWHCAWLQKDLIRSDKGLRTVLALAGSTIGVKCPLLSPPPLVSTSKSCISLVMSLHGINTQIWEHSPSDSSAAIIPTSQVGP